MAAYGEGPYGAGAFGGALRKAIMIIRLPAGPVIVRQPPKVAVALRRGRRRR